MKRVKIYFAIIILVIHYSSCKSIEVNKYLKRGSKFEQSNKYDSAMSAYNKAIEVNSECEKAYYKRGSLKDRIGDYVGAIEDFNKAIALKYNYIDAYYGRGNTRGKSKDYSGAIEDYTKVIELNHKASGAYFSRGFEKYYHLDNKEGACLDYKKAAELGSINARIFLQKYCK